MNETDTPNQGSSLNVQDILFILFRHKWKIVLFGLLGIAAAGAVFFMKKPIYESNAKVMIRYVTETRDLIKSGPNDPDVIRDPNSPTTVINSEIEILASQDALVQVARTLTPERVLAAHGGGTNVFQAAGVLGGRLKVSQERNSSVIKITLGHLDPEIAREALDALLKEYRRRHVEVHRPVTASDDLRAQTDQLRFQLGETARQLSKAKDEADIIDLTQAKTDLAAQRSTLQTDIFATEAELASLRAEFLPLVEEAQAPGTNATAEASTEAPATPSRAPRDVALAQSLNQQLSALRAEERDLLMVWQTNSTPIVELQRRISDLELALEKLGIDPATVQAASAFAPNRGMSAPIPYNPDRNPMRIPALEARLAKLKEQISQVEQKARRIEAVENSITALEREKKSQEERLSYFESTIERLRFDQTVTSGKINNVTVLENPTPPTRDTSKLQKMMAMAFGGLFGAGLALAFALEMFLDPTVKRPKDVEGKLRLPVFATIPQIAKSRSRKGKASPEKQLPGNLELARGEMAPWDESDPLIPYYEAIRDRIVMSYTGDAHKPKIVGLTSCNPGAGVTRLSLGVAAALSRDAERNVLFIGMERNRVSITSFERGNPSEGLPNGNGKELNGHSNASAEPAANGSPNFNSEEFFVEKSLQSLAQNGRGLSGASVVQSFSEMMPRLKTSNYDYIIFDLPPITQTSGSLRLASQMERTLLVIEAEKTHKDKVERARKLLTGSRAQLFAVLNKTKSYVPGFVSDDSSL